MATHRKDILDILGLVVDSRDRLKNGKRFKFHVEQCKSLCTYTLDKLSNYIDDNGRYLRGVVCSERVERAWKEVYRAMKEAETYLNHCSTDSRRFKCFILANTGEAFAVHMHDLTWSFLCLDLALLCPIEDWNDRIGLTEFGNRIINNFFTKMSVLHLEQYGFKFHDYWHLLMACNPTVAKAWTSTQKKKIGVLRFMERKLLATITNECNTESANDLPTWLQIPAKDLIKKKTIGEGSYGKVYEGSWLGHRVAIKDIPIDARDLFDTETKVLAKLQSPFIVQLIGTCLEGSHCSIVMELVRYSLEKLLMNSGKEAPLALPVAVDIMLQISRGMEYLHHQGIMHTDLKASNVLIEPSAVPEFTRQGYGRVKLCDFGMASSRLTSFRCEDPKGTCYWRAPEAFPFPNEELLQEIDSLKEYTYKADVYSYGMTCYEILTGEQPFLGVNPKDLYRMIVQGRRPNLQRSCPAVLADFIVKCWETDPSRRPCFAQVSTFMRNMKLFILRGNDPCMVLLQSVRSKEEAFDEIPAGMKVALISRALHIVPPEVKRRYIANVAPIMLSEILNAQRRHPSLVFQNSDHLFLRPSLVFQNNDDLFNIDDLLRSSVKVLGSGSFGTTCKATIHNSSLVVKILSQENHLGETRACFLGKLKHANLVSLQAYYICKGAGDLLIYKYYPKGSLYSLLHGGTKVLQWDWRMKIAAEVALGLAFLHKSGMVHGNVKSSNVLLDYNGSACLADSCLARVVENLSVIENFLEQCKSDVYSFGVLLLELLTGKDSSSDSTDLPTWIRSIKEEKLIEVLAVSENRPCMLKLLRIAMCCTDTRPTMTKVVKMVVDLEESLMRNWAAHRMYVISWSGAEMEA